MLKSATMFGLFLTASLIMLSSVAAAILIDNMNLFENTMASGKHYDKNDNYQEYESYYSNDNKYTPDYNYYYEPMKQQQQQSSYDYNNNYGYDNNKQIDLNIFEKSKNICLSLTEQEIERIVKISVKAVK